MKITEDSLEQNIENIADLLWLSQYTGISTYVEESSSSLPQEEPKEQEKLLEKSIDEVKNNKKELEIHTKEQTNTIETKGRPAKAFQSPKKLALSNYREWEKAFRLVNLQTQSNRVQELDEEATAESIAMSDIYDLKFHYKLEKRFSLSVVIDKGESMELWSELIENFKAMLLTQGVFSAIHIYYLDSNNSIAKLYYDKSLKQNAHKKNIITDGKSNLIWVMSDCLCASWESGDAFGLIDEWSKNSFTSIIQMFPKQMWMGTMLYQANQTRFKTKIFHPANKKLLHKSRRGKRASNGTKIPVVTFNPYALQSWAKVVTNYPKSSISGIEIQDFDFEHTVVDQSTISLENRMSRFYSQASLSAQQLAFYMSVLPVDYQIVRMVQELKCDQKEHVHIAEVFLGGLIKQHKVNNSYRYEFYKGVRESLNANLTAKESLEILQSMSEFVANHLGVGFDFDALIEDPSSLLADGDTIADESIAFAKTVSDTLKRGGGKGLEIGNEIGKKIEKSIEKNTIKDKEIDFPIIVDTSISSYNGAATRNYFTFTAYLSAPLADGYSVYLNFDNLAGGWFYETQDGGHTKLDSNGTVCTIDRKIRVSGNRKVRMGIFKDDSLNVINGYSQSISFDVSKISISNSDEKLYYELGTAYYTEREYTLAIEAYKKALEINPNNGDTYYSIGNTYHYRGDYNLSIESYKKSMEINPKNDNVYTNMGTAYFDQKEYTQAMEVYKKSLEINPKNDMTYYNIGNIYYTKKEYSQAIKSYKKSIEINPKKDEAYYNIGLAYKNQGEYNLSIEAFKKGLEINPKKDKAYTHMGYIYAIKGKYNLSIEAFKKVLEINPKNHEAYTSIGVAYDDLNQSDKAEFFYKKAKELRLEKNYIDIKSHSSDIDLYKKAIELNPRDNKAYYEMGNAYIDIKEYDKAMAIYQELLEINPKSYLAYSGMGDIYCKTERYTNALSLYQQSISINPKDEKVYNNMAMAYEKIKEYSKAIDAYQKSIAIEPKDNEVRYAKIQELEKKLLDKKPIKKIVNWIFDILKD